ncbi:MAG: hypothetical protein KF865_01620 [Bdellovibrionaceae bacterium]|nr:hypothetical protein [Pseudobdellovibrionaceae bacterium]
MKITNVIAMALALALSKTALAESSESKPVHRGEYYAFSRELAEKLSLDYETIIQVVKPTSGENIVVKVDERNQVDISIFDNEQFASARMDFVRQ